MADALKRIQWSRDKETQDRVLYYLFQKSKAVLTKGTAAQKELDIANRVYSQKVNLFAACMICAANPTIGAAIDAGKPVSDSDIEFVVGTDQWDKLASAEV